MKFPTDHHHNVSGAAQAVCASHMCVPCHQGGAQEGKEAALAADTHIFHFPCGKAAFPASTGRMDAAACSSALGPA